MLVQLALVASRNREQATVLFVARVDRCPGRDDRIGGAERKIKQILVQRVPAGDTSPLTVASSRCT
jgi:hypothetical protein